MNRITPEALYRLLPALHRLRDADEGEPMRQLISVLAREGAVVEESIEQLLDNLFIETCEDWAAPYIGGTIGYKTLYDVEGANISSRAEVANTIGYRRRKGTAAVLEAIARDVTGWPAHVVEYFQTTATTQHMNHIRPAHHLAPELRNPLALEPFGRAFDRNSHVVDARSILQTTARKSIGGKHNFPNIGLWLWRLMAAGLVQVPASRVDMRRFRFDPLGADRQLVNLPQPEDSITSISQPEHVPGDITLRMLDSNPALWYGAGRAFELFLDGEAIPVTRIEACDLSDDAPGWNHTPHAAIPAAELAEIEGIDPLNPPANALVRVDPVLGRIAFPNEEPGDLRVTFHLGFPGRIGGGVYVRSAALTRDPGQSLLQVPSVDHPTIQSALDDVALTGGIVEITSSDVFQDAVSIIAQGPVEIILRAANGQRPVLRPPAPLTVTGAEDARIVLDGFVLDGQPLQILPNADGASASAASLRDLTLVPGLSFTDSGDPAFPGATSLEVSTVGLELTLERVITGAIRLSQTTNMDCTSCLIDAAALPARDSAEGLAIAGLGGSGDPAGAITLRACTVLGRIDARVFPLISNSVLHARADDSSPPVRARRQQEGCIRFSYVPARSVTPRRYRCQPQLGITQAIAAREEETGTEITQAEQELIAARVIRRMKPAFTAQSASHPAYAQLHGLCPIDIRQGADDEGEMGVWHFLHGPQRETNLRVRLEEYLRFGLEAGIFYEN